VAVWVGGWVGEAAPLCDWYCGLGSVVLVPPRRVATHTRTHARTQGHGHCPADALAAHAAVGRLQVGSGAPAESQHFSEGRDPQMKVIIRLIGSWIFQGRDLPCQHPHEGAHWVRKD
jgi:hypothetical protein